MEDKDIVILTDEELKAQDRDQQREACCLIMYGMDKLSEGMRLMESGSDEFVCLMQKRVGLLEPLGMLQSKCDFKDWMYRDWKKELEEAEEKQPDSDPPKPEWDGESV